MSLRFGTDCIPPGPPSLTSSRVTSPGYAKDRHLQPR